MKVFLYVGLTLVLALVAWFVLDKDQAVDEKAVLAEQLNVTDAYAFQTSKSQTAGAVFLTIENSSDVEYRLMGASTDMSNSVELHSMTTADDMMEMRQLSEIILPPQSTVVLEPTGYHIMLMGLREPLEKGSSFPLRVIISGGNSINIDVDIVKAGQKPKS